MKALRVAIHIVFIVFSLELAMLLLDVLFAGFIGTSYVTAIVVLMYVVLLTHVAWCTTACLYLDSNSTVIVSIVPSRTMGCVMFLINIAIIALFIYTSQMLTAYAIWVALLASSHVFAIQLQMFARLLDNECGV